MSNKQPIYHVTHDRFTVTKQKKFICDGKLIPKTKTFCTQNRRSIQMNSRRLQLSLYAVFTFLARKILTVTYEIIHSVLLFIDEAIPSSQRSS